MSLFDELSNNGAEDTTINSDDFGGFMVSKNIVENKLPIKYSFREESSIKQCNGWTLYSENDDEDYVADPNNFVILGAVSMFNISQVMREIFSAPYGTDLCWLYESGVHTGFYDLANDCETTIEEILNRK